MAKVSYKKQIYREMVETMAKVAQKLLAKDHGNLIPGNSYTTKAVWKKVGRINCETESDLIIENELVGSLKIPAKDIFYYIIKYQKDAGLTGSKALVWTIPDERKIAASATISFPSKKQMEKTASLVKGLSKYDRETAALSIADGCIRNITLNTGNYYIAENKIRIKAENYTPIQEFKHLSFKIGPAELCHMYGDCTLSIYKDDNGSPLSYLNPYNIRLVIENADGWSISTNEIIPLSDDYLKIYDSEYSLIDEDDCIPSVNVEREAHVEERSGLTIPDTGCELVLSSQEPVTSESHISTSGAVNSPNHRVAEKTRLDTITTANPSGRNVAKNNGEPDLRYATGPLTSDDSGTRKTAVCSNRHGPSHKHKRYAPAKRKKGRFVNASGHKKYIKHCVKNLQKCTKRNE